MDQLGGATSRGEFGTLLKALFAAECRASFVWKRWVGLRGRRIHVFSCRVPQAYSKWHVRFENKRDVVAGYSGLVFVDSETGMVMRITSEAEDLPPTIPIQQARGELDYDFVTINGHEHLLPLRSLTRLRSDRYRSKNEVEFREYRKFGSESSISFDTPKPLPKDQTEEQPPK
jgi:hypothetical protein